MESVETLPAAIVIDDDGWRILKVGTFTKRIDLLAFVFAMNDYMRKLEETIPFGVGAKMFLDAELPSVAAPAASEQISVFMAQMTYNRLMKEAEELQKKDPCSQLADSPPTTAGHSGSGSELESLPGLSLGESKIPTA